MGIVIRAEDCKPEVVKVNFSLAAFYMPSDSDHSGEKRLNIQGAELSIPTLEDALADIKAFDQFKGTWWTSSPVTKNEKVVDIDGLTCFYAVNERESGYHKGFDDDEAKGIAYDKNVIDKSTKINNRNKSEKADAYRRIISALYRGMGAESESEVKDYAKDLVAAVVDARVNLSNVLDDQMKKVGSRKIIPSFYPNPERAAEKMLIGHEYDEYLEHWIDELSEYAASVETKNRKALSQAKSRKEDRLSDTRRFVVDRRYNDEAFVRLKITAPSIAKLPKRFMILSSEDASDAEIQTQLKEFYGISQEEASSIFDNLKNSNPALCKKRMVFRKPEDGSDFAISEFFLGDATALAKDGFKTNSGAYGQVNSMRDKFEPAKEIKRTLVKVEEAFGGERYTVSSYYDDSLMGLEDILHTSDIDQAVDFAWDKYDQGFTIKVVNNNTGEDVTIKENDIDMTDIDAPYIMQDMIMEIKDVITEDKKLVVESWNGGYLVRPYKDYNEGLINQKDIRTHYLKSFSDENDVMDFYIKNGIAQGKDQFIVK